MACRKECSGCPEQAGEGWSRCSQWSLRAAREQDTDDEKATSPISHHVILTEDWFSSSSKDPMLAKVLLPAW